MCWPNWRLCRISDWAWLSPSSHKWNDLRGLYQLARKLLTEDLETSVLTWLWQDLPKPTDSTHPASHFTLSNTSKVHHICRVSCPSQAVGCPGLPICLAKEKQLTVTEGKQRILGFEKPHLWRGRQLLPEILAQLPVTIAIHTHPTSTGLSVDSDRLKKDSKKHQAYLHTKLYGTMFILGNSRNHQLK